MRMLATHWPFHRHVWRYTKPGWERSCETCSRVEEARLINAGMEKIWVRAFP